MLTLPQTLSPLCVPSVAPPLGSTVPRLWTKPLRELTRETSYGFAVIDFARDVLREPLDPWQEWLVIHAGELLEDGRPRFRHVLILVARQNGKTHLLKVLSLYWLFVEQWPLVLATSDKLENAKEAWKKAVDLAEATPLLAESIQAVLRGNNDIHIATTDGCKYKIAAANRNGGRGLSVDRLIQDELREQYSRDAFNAAFFAMNARPYAQAFSISNMGDDKSVVLNELRDEALTFVETGVGDPRVALFEWSAEEGSDVLDERAWAAANPNFMRRIDYDVIAGSARHAASKGGEVEADFKTEVLCIRVKVLNPAVNSSAWTACEVPGDLSGLRSRIAVCLDIAPDRHHATIVAAGVMADGRVRVEVVEAFDGPAATAKLRKALPGLLTKIKPQVLGWMPNGPAAALAADLKDRKGWPPPGTKVEEIRAEVSAVCMAFAEQVDSHAVVHSGQALLTTHVTAAEKLRSGDTWRFSRKGEGHCDAAYAAAGAAYLARTLPAPIGRPRLVTAS